MRLTPIERFEALYVVLPDGCWFWCGGRDGQGLYGRFWDSVHQRNTEAHRWSYVHFTGKRIPKGHDVHHLCVNSWCVNWRHHKPVPPAINQKYRRRRRCLKHDCIMHKQGGRRVCKKCRNEYQKAWRARQVNKARVAKETVGRAA